MRRVLVIWACFGLFVAVVMAGMGWISHLTLKLDREYTAERRKAQVEEDVRLALWQMDSALATLITRENARPHFHYSPLYPAEVAYSSKNKKNKALSYGEVLLPSPLTSFESDFIHLHFQIDPQGKLTSPQVPSAEEQAVITSKEQSDQQEESFKPRVSELKRLKDRVKVNDIVLACATACVLPNGSEAQVAWGAPQSQVRYFTPNQSAPNTSIAQVPGLPQSGQQIDNNLEENQSPTANGSPGSLLFQLLAGDTPEQQAQTVVKPKVVPSNNGARYKTEQQKKYNDSAWASRLNAQTESRRLQKLGGQYQLNQKQELLAGGYGNWQAGDLRVLEGESEPLWIDGELMLMRRVSIGGQIYIQGAWLDWDKIRPWLVDQIDYLLPAATLVAATGARGSANIDRMFATAPIRLKPGALVLASALPISSTVGNSLAIAWICIALGVGAVGLLLSSSIALGERRGAFVSAVTHELRTPLTTFRMYAQMLNDDMVPDETKRKEYLQTLCVESDRLGHLIENVLAYSRLEKVNGKNRSQDISVEQVIDRLEHRLAQRAEQAGMELVVDTGDVSSARLRTDLGALDQILFNLVDNACKYAQSADDARIHLDISAEAGQLCFRVRDHGPGIGADVRPRLFKPFAKSAAVAAESAPGVGLGLALCRRMAGGLGGRLKVEEPADGGVAFVLRLPRLQS